ncbi:diadenosine tetraphosphatase [Solemya velesiana gill symbiont]|uniref:Diadenosine tetraphosphatase n=2 Tax=Solemya velesiana gill symbiont TaxID=1918948 RepID=A0A1T2KXG0_9GAMM|nr:diadenosine tetraphosphatase [Solemya velesiana gill symbiont]
MDLGQFEEPLLLFGGPYSNLQATQALHMETDRLGIPPERVICNGDIVAYCAQPEETVDFVRDWGIHVVAGNYKTSLAAGSPDCGCGFEAGTACALLSDNWYPFANAAISDENRNWMQGLPHAIRFGLNSFKFHVIHGTPSAINRFVFASTPRQEKQAELETARTDVIIGGHCGIPFGERLGNGYWLNTGVIGMPANDATREGWYLLIAGERHGIRASWHRLGYDNQQAYSAMTEAGMNNGYADALQSGLWPSMDVLPESERTLRGKPISLDDMILERD